MAKVGSLYLKGAKGKLAGATLYQSGGETIIRDITAPKNPKTGAQILQRVIMNTVMKNYKAMKVICDHSFEGVTMGADSMARFMSVNARYLRERAASIQATGQSLDVFYNFIPLKSNKYAPAAMYVSEGTLPQVVATVVHLNDNYVGRLNLSANTYAQVAAQYTLQRGDQLTFLTVEKLPAGNFEFKYSRVILDPRTESGDAAPMSSAFVADNAIAFANSRNEGSYTQLEFNEGLAIRHTVGNVVAAAVIVSRRSGDYWFRSNAQLAISEDAIGSDLISLTAAMAASQTVSNVDVASELYLNNAGTGGAQGSTNVNSGSPSLSNTLLINNTSQPSSGGSTQISGSLSSVMLFGSNLSQTQFYAKKQGSDTQIAPSSTSNTRIEWTNLQGGAGSITYFYMGEELVYTISVASDGPSSEG